MSLNINKKRWGEVLEVFRQPYPFYYTGTGFLFVAGIVLIMSLLFNYLFEPFVVYRPEHKFDYFWISMVHSFNAFLVVFVILFIKSRKINEDSWTVGKEIGLIGLMLLMIGVCQFLTRDLIYDNPDNWSLRYLLEEIRNTFLVGILFVIILVPINYLRLLKAHLITAQSINAQSLQVQTPESSSVISIITQQKSDDFEMDITRFLYAKADGNYLEFFLESEATASKLIKRMTLKELEQQLEPFPAFLKTHRSYLVNLQKVIHVKGNAQGYFLQLKGVNEEVPVSRGMISKFEEQYAN
ncbi:LytR/AlgR family response regulator transcription factor [Cecembia rubra]|uniref:LytR/AlgR family response regulator transcription factor n=1 Tax=Cecembia rubra TaxID=1485585 RepID=UPI002715200D|nr:LytTR family DNA-binding domain-containing protein [Cecembia rubra]